MKAQTAAAATEEQPQTCTWSFEMETKCVLSTAKFFVWALLYALLDINVVVTQTAMRKTEHYSRMIREDQAAAALPKSSNPTFDNDRIHSVSIDPFTPELIINHSQSSKTDISLKRVDSASKHLYLSSCNASVHWPICWHQWKVTQCAEKKHHGLRCPVYEETQWSSSYNYYMICQVWER